MELAFSMSLTLSSPMTAYLLDLRSLAQILAFFFKISVASSMTAFSE